MKKDLLKKQFGLCYLFKFVFSQVLYLGGYMSITSDNYYYFNPVVRHKYLTVDCVPCDYQTAKDRANNLRHLVNMIDAKRGGYGKFVCKNYIDIYPTGDKEKI